MTTHQFAALLLSDTPDIPFTFGHGIKFFDRSPSVKGLFTFKETDGVLNIDVTKIEKGYTEKEQEEIFNLCLNKDHWKNPINAMVDQSVVDRIDTDKIQNILSDQVGGGVEIRHLPKKNKYHITAPGYFETIGA